MRAILCSGSEANILAENHNLNAGRDVKYMAVLMNHLRVVCCLNRPNHTFGRTKGRVGHVLTSQQEGLVLGFRVEL